MTRFSLAGAVVLFTFSTCAGAENKPAAGRLEPLARFIGDWTVDGRWSNGEELHARATYFWGLNKQIIQAKNWVRDGDKEYQRYETVMAWHAAKKSLVILSFPYNGGVWENRVEPANDDGLHIGWAPYNEGDSPSLRQTISFKGKDAFLWKVEGKQDGAWKPLIEATWKRKAN